MANDGYTQVPPNSTGNKVDCASLSSGANTVYRQRIVIADNTRSANFAVVSSGSLQVLVQNAVAISGSVLAAVSGQVSLGPGTSNIGTINNISAAVSLAAGTNNIGAVSNAAGTALMGAVSLAAGTANIGFLNNISATVLVAGEIANGSSLSTTNKPVLMGGNDSAGGAGGVARTLLLDTSGRVILGAGANNIGAVSVAAGTALMGAVSLAAGTANIGFLNNISATVTVAITTFATAGGQQINVADTANNALRVNVVAGSGSGANPVSIAAGTSNIGFINNISATVLVAGEIANGSSLSTTNKPVLMGGNDSAGGAGGVARTLLLDTSGRIILGTGTNNVGAVSLAAGTANIGSINNISAAVVLGAGSALVGAISVAAGTALMGAVSLAAGTANIGFINNISATVNVAVTSFGSMLVNVNVAAQSAGNILAVQGPVAFNASVTAANQPQLMGGRVKVSISTTATAHAAVWAWFDKAGHQIVQMNAASLHPSATHGPKTVTLSASANTVLVASAGTACIFVTAIKVTSNLAAVTRCDIYETASSAAPEDSTYLAIGGGGYTLQYNPPWVLSAGQALSARLKPSASAQVLATVHFYVGPA